MKITLNGIERELAPATSVHALLQAAGYGERRVAVQINLEIVPRSQHATQQLENGNQVDIVHATDGG